MPKICLINFLYQAVIVREEIVLQLCKVTLNGLIWRNVTPMAS